MTQRHRGWFHRGIVLAVLLLGTPLGQVAGQSGDALVVIVNPRNSAGQTLTRGDVQKILLGSKTTWPNGSAILVILRPAGTPERSMVLNTFAGFKEAIFTRRQMQAAFTGNNPVAVKDAATEADVKNAVKSNASAVGFIHKKDLDDSVKAVLTVE